MRLINNDEVNQVLRMADCIRVQGRGIQGLVDYGAIHRPRVDLYYPAEGPESYFRWGSMEGASSQYFAIRMKSDIVSWPKTDDGGWTEEKHCIEPGTYCGLIFLLSTKNGEPLALINDGLLQHFRVGGGAGIGAKYLSREDSEVVGLIGSGGMARTFLDAFCCVRPIKECRVYSPTKGHKEAFAEEMSDKLGIRVVAVSGPQKAIAGADIVSSATDSMVPVYDAAWLEEGQHVTNLGRREMPEEAISRFDVVVRQGVAGLQMKQTDIFQAERGHSPAAASSVAPLSNSVSYQKRIHRQDLVVIVPNLWIVERVAISQSSKILSPVSVRVERRVIRSRFIGTWETKGCSFRQSVVWCTKKDYRTKYGPGYSYRLAPARYTGLVRMSPKAKVEAVSANADHDFSKLNLDVIRVVRDHGVEADAHFGTTVQHLHHIKRTRPDKIFVRCTCSPSRGFTSGTPSVILSGVDP